MLLVIASLLIAVIAAGGTLAYSRSLPLAVLAYTVFGFASMLILALMLSLNGTKIQDGSWLMPCPTLDVSGKPEVSTVEPEGLWLQFNSDSETKRVFFVSRIKNGSIQYELAKDLSRCGVSIDFTDSQEIAFDSLHEKPGVWDALVLDIDYCSSLDSLESVIEDLIKFRVAVPSVPTILVSSQFRSDDFELQRLSITDVSVRTSSSTDSFVDALASAKANNAHWQQRVGPLRLSTGPRSSF